MLSSGRVADPIASDRNEAIIEDHTSAAIGRFTHRGVVFSERVGGPGSYVVGAH